MKQENTDKSYSEIESFLGEAEKILRQKYIEAKEAEDKELQEIVKKKVNELISFNESLFEVFHKKN